MRVIEGAKAAKLEIHGLPRQLSPTEAAIFRTRTHQVFGRLGDDVDVDVRIIRGRQRDQPSAARRDESHVTGSDPADATNRPDFTATAPRDFGAELILAPEAREQLELALTQIERGDLLYNTWGLSRLRRQGCLVLNFCGPSGTGKTMCAHYTAARLNQRIIETSTSRLKSSLVGEGPKNVEWAFAEADRQNALLFIDEGETLVPSRVAVSHSSDNEMNGMCTTALLQMERHSGVVVFATNYAERYDEAAQTRMWSIHFSVPDVTAREAIWSSFFSAARLPLHGDVTVARLAAASEGLVGRQILRAVINAATMAAQGDRPVVMASDFERAIAMARVGNASSNPHLKLDTAAIANAIRSSLPHHEAASDGAA